MDQTLLMININVLWYSENAYQANDNNDNNPTRDVTKKIKKT
jgi:hypothetical protein